MLLTRLNNPIKRKYSNLAAYAQPSHGHMIDRQQHFYQNKILDNYLRQSPTPLTLRQLMFYERHCNTERLLKSANYVRKELPIRIAHRIREFQKLPYILGTNPHIQCVYDLYWRSFESIRNIPEIKSRQDNEKFCRALMKSLDTHQVVIPELAKGIHDCEKVYQSIVDMNKLDLFMDATLRSRISRRVISEHHLVLSGKKASIFNECSSSDILSKCIGLVQAHTRLANGVQDLPKIVLDGKDTKFTYVSEHIQYILYQLLSNAMRHSVLNQNQTITITYSSNETDVLFRISDQGKGMSNNKFAHIWSYGNHKNMDRVEHHEAKLDEQESNLATPLGIGLPMSKVYAEYWGGEIKLMTMEGFGTDAYLKIPRLGTQNENLHNNDSPLDGAIMC